jgi:hypothetical protein
MADTGNTPTGNPGAGRAETTSAPDPVAVPAAGTAGLSTSNTPSATTTGGGVEDQVGNVELTDADFRKDGNLRKDAVRRIEENAPPRGGERSYNEVTGETTVTTTVGGQTVTFVEEGDTRGRSKRGETGMDSLARASEDAEESN